MDNAECKPIYDLCTNPTAYVNGFSTNIDKEMAGLLTTTSENFPLRRVSPKRFCLDGLYPKVPSSLRAFSHVKHLIPNCTDPRSRGITTQAAKALRKRDPNKSEVVQNIIRTVLKEKILSDLLHSFPNTRISMVPPT